MGRRSKSEAIKQSGDFEQEVSLLDSSQGIRSTCGSSDGSEGSEGSVVATTSFKAMLVSLRAEKERTELRLQELRWYREQWDDDVRLLKEKWRLQRKVLAENVSSRENGDSLRRGKRNGLSP